MRMRFKFKKLLAFVLCAAMVLSSVSFAASATEEEPTSTEVVELREENVKHFDMGDGTYQAVMYAHPVHELDEDGNWQDIDFGLSLSQTSGTSVYASEVSGTSFAANYTANQPLMSLSGEDDSISMTLVVPQTGVSTWARQTPVAAEVIEPDRSLDTFEEAKEAKFSSTVLYEEVMPGIDLEYIADLYTVKENIIVKEPMSSYAYTFTLNLDGLYPVLMDEGCILIYDAETDEQKYEIPMPYMYDGLGNVSDAVYYTLDENNGVYYLTVTADAEWINEEERTFPVTIDPSVTKILSSVYDTYISSTLPDSNLGSSTELWLRENRTTYIRPTATFTVTSGKVLLKATLVGYYYYYDYVTAGSLVATAHKVVNGQWYESTLNWNLASSWDNFGLDEEVLDTQRAYGNIGATVDSPKVIEFDITQAARDWSSGDSPNYGIGLDFSYGNKSVIIKSSESGTDYSPRFTYEYANGFYYTNLYDSTMSENSGYIPQAINAANAAFSKQFDVYFCESTAPVHDASLTDACTNGPNVPCDYNCQGYHHKDIYYIAKQLKARIKSTGERIVYWTDHAANTYCNHESGDCNEVDGFSSVIAVVFLGYDVIHMMNMVPEDASSAMLKACMGINLIHETAHTFGLPDAYNDPEHDVDGECVCVMERYETGDTLKLLTFYAGIENQTSNAFCSSCAADLQTYIANS